MPLNDKFPDSLIAIKKPQSVGVDRGGWCVKTSYESGRSYPSSLIVFVIYD